MNALFSVQVVKSQYYNKARRYTMKDFFANMSNNS